MSKKSLKVLLTSPEAKVPSRAYPTDTGYDLFVSRDITITATPQAFPTGVKVIIPPGYGLRFREKSGKALLGIEIKAGTIDETYRGELKVVASTHAYGGIKLRAGEAICQMVLEKRHDAEIEVLTYDQFESETDRGEGGFGSTGR